LSVEEQFYLVFPTLFLIAAAVRMRVSLRARLAVGLAVVMVGSFVLSVLQTSSDPTVAFFSPFTRAWELALGAMIAIGTPLLLRAGAGLAAGATWVGLGAILVAAFAFDSQTAYPGYLVAIPVIGAGLVIAGGVAAPRRGVEMVLRLAPFAWLGDLSYSLYLWHWPLLIIAAESRQRTSLSFQQSVPWITLALVASIATYHLVENPVRHSRSLMARRWSSVVLGVGLIGLALVVATATLPPSPRVAVSPSIVIPAGTDAEVATAVRDSVGIQHLPADLTPSMAAILHDFGAPTGPCTPQISATTVPACVFGDPSGSHTMVLYGDSHALMWFTAVNAIAKQAHWRLVLLGHGYCMANRYSPAVRSSAALFATCGQWQDFAEARIRRLHPDLVVVTQALQPGPGRVPYTPKQWQLGLETTLRQISSPGTSFVVLGNLPEADPGPPNCLAQHPDQVQSCSGPLPDPKYNAAEQRAVGAMGGRYVSVVPWFCAQRCSAVIGRYQPYVNALHVSATYSLFLRQVLAEKLQLSRY
jgi:hypothetical protein